MSILPFDNSFLALPGILYARVQPTPVADPRLVRVNTALAGVLGLDAHALASPEGAAVLAGNQVPPGAASIALAYAGHQFGQFVPRLGDGRAILLGEIVGRDGVRRDIQLKGSGRTPFSRGGDGRAALGPVLREYLVSEAMAALGIPTTRALAAVTTGEAVYRETALPGAVLTRIAASHIRVGTFQYVATQGDPAALQALAEHAIARHDPAAASSDQPVRALLEGVVRRQAELVARWLLVGFIHGVMNTDNTAVSGETIDYGPCAFMDAYDPATVFSSIDHAGRYAYARQPRIAQWNLARLAETLLPLLAAQTDAAVAIATEVLDGFAPAFNAAYLGGLRRKLGLESERDGDSALAQDLLDAMARTRADFTLVFRRLADAADGDDAGLRALLGDAAWDAWAARWRRRLEQEGGDPAAVMRAANPAVIPRNHLVEAMIAAAVRSGDFAPFEEMLDVVARPYEDRPEGCRYARPPAEGEQVRQTFCGT
jgi:uncharacterized protein YdiU (UPF0061 family)